MKTFGVVMIVVLGYSILMGDANFWTWIGLGAAIALVMDKTVGVAEYLKGRMDYYNSGR